MVCIRKAKADEAPLLSALALRSKAYWGYSKEFMHACKKELTYSAQTIANDNFVFFVAVEGEKIIGFYALEFLSDKEVELEALFVEPEFIGKGYGRKLIEHAKRLAIESGALIMKIQGDPNAEDFYLAAGGVREGNRESASIPGRYLPLYVIPLDDRNIA